MRAYGLYRRMFARLRGFGRDRRGMIAVKFALALPAIAVLALGAVDLHAIQTLKGRMQATADAAALAGAAELGLAVEESGPIGRAEQWANAHIAEWSDPIDVTVKATVFDIPDGARAIKVEMKGTRTSFFGNLLPPGGWKLESEATATTVGMTPLCVIGANTSRNNVIRAGDSSRMNAPACLIHSNGDIDAQGGRISAGAVQAVDTTRGNILPAAYEGAAEIEDPFSGLNLGKARTCTGSETILKLETGFHVFPPGVHCGGVEVGGDAELLLSAGEHWFLGGNLIVRDEGVLDGKDVVVFFDKASKFEFKHQASVTLDGRKSGAYAGFVMVGTRDNTQDFVIESDHVETLLGVIYVPSARLIVRGRAEVAKESAWTVIVADMIELKGSPQLFINANYDASDVPVPDGVGPRQGGGRLID